MRPINKNLYQHNQTIYNPYGNAKNDLILALGSFCSYCERQGFSAALEIEHIKDKYTYPAEMFKWNNFLLACKNCNTCKSIKSTTGVLLPDRGNTFEIFIYLESGFIKVNPKINNSLKPQAQVLLDLVRLDRIPNRNGYTGNDTLWQERKKTWNLSQRYLNKYLQGICDIETVKDLALAQGFWSIWMQAFEDFPDVQKELITSFKGTRTEFFNL